MVVSFVGCSGAFKLAYQRLLVGKLPRGVLGVAQVPIHHHIEDPAGAGDELRLHVEGVLELGSQTDRSWFVVSGRAVGDGNVHLDSLDGPVHG